MSIYCQRCGKSLIDSEIGSVGEKGREGRGEVQVGIMKFMYKLNKEQNDLLLLVLVAYAQNDSIHS